jgi:nucleotide-binding universal stress UspA family protein
MVNKNNKGSGDDTAPFRRILVPIPSERFPQGAVERGMELAAKFGSELLMLYIIEEKVIQTMDHAAEMVLTRSQREEMESKLLEQHMEEAEKIQFIRVKRLADSRDVDFRKYIRSGKFGHEINRLITEESADLVVMELADDTLLRYNIIDHCPVPIWLERGGGKGIDEILGICTNRAPNEIVPAISAGLARRYNAHLTMEYIVDSNGGEEELSRCGQDLLQQMASQYEPDVKMRTRCILGPLGPTTLKSADRLNADLVIIGRAAAKKGFLGFGKKDDKVQVARETNHSVLMIN